MSAMWWACSIVAVILASLAGWHMGRLAGMREMLKGPKPAVTPNLDWGKKP